MKHVKLRRRGVLLYSGGIDSTLSAIILVSQDVDLVALSINYPGRPNGEVRAAKQITNQLPFSAFVEVTLGTGDALRKSPDGPRALKGWIPYRNLLFWAIAAHKAVMLDAQFVAAGHGSLDGTFFSDASGEFFEHLKQVLRFTGNSSGKQAIGVELPVFSANDEFLRSIARKNWRLVKKTWSCWLDNHNHCMSCFACQERQSFLATLVGPDPEC